MNDKSDNIKEKVIEALTKCLGVVTDACKSVKISRQTFYRWCKEDADFKERVDDIQNVTLDVVESQLFKAIKDGNLTAIIFYLKTKGKKRGYIEKQQMEHTGRDGKDLIPPPVEIIQAERMLPINPDNEI